MRVHLALYDPSRPSQDGSFWSWRSSALHRTLLDRLYYDFASANRPDDPGTITASTIVGGFAQLTRDWICVYRFGNGGRDAHGRPGRFVIVRPGFIALTTAG